jgi:leucyl aminopeptidase (aminopeptidase T)
MDAGDDDVDSLASQSVDEEKLRNSAKTVIETCMQLRSHENLLVITDPHTAEIGQALYEAGSQVSDRVLMVMMPSTHRHGQEPPSPVADLMRRQHVVIAATRYSLTHTRARLISSKDGARIATMPGVTRSMLIEGGMTADFDALQNHIASMARILRKHRNVKIMNDDGDAMEFVISGRWNLEDNGICNRPGQVTNLPAGKIFAEVKPESVSGVLKINGTWDSISITEPISIIVDEGKIVDIQTTDEGVLGDQILELIDEKMETIKIVEFGFGMNPKARISGSALEDEKVLGSCYIVLQQPASRRSHELRATGILTEQTVLLGDHQLIDKGEFIE